MNLFIRNADMKIVSLLLLLLTACSDDAETDAIIKDGKNQETEVVEIESLDRTIKTVVGGRGSLEVPTWIPEGFPFPTGCKIKFDFGKTQNMGSLALACNNSPKGLEDYYSGALENEGWLATDSATSVTIFKKENITLSVTIMEDRKKESHSKISLLFNYK